MCRPSTLLVTPIALEAFPYSHVALGCLVAAALIVRLLKLFWRTNRLVWGSPRARQS